MSPPRIEPPSDAHERRAAKPVIVYALDRLPPYDAALYERAREHMAKVGETVVPPREARAFDVQAGHFFRIVSVGARRSATSTCGARQISPSGSSAGKRG